MALQSKADQQIGMADENKIQHSDIEQSIGDSVTDQNSAELTSTSNGATPETIEDAKLRTPWYFSPKLYIGLLLVGFVVFVIIDSATTGYTRDAVNSFLNWIQENPIAGFFLFALGKTDNVD